MLDSAREAVAFASGKAPEEIESDRILRLALTKLIEIIGEAADRVRPETRATYPDVPWRRAIDMRNRLVHGYDTIDPRIVWDVVQNNLPPFIAHRRAGADSRRGRRRVTIRG
ncbi:MAG TPA: HepT-like ribonuclease domain-containing protein [Thermomicrobiales bacterium]|nr:HepT-like ribonuclease domain-containing protein [Thermomicrobiales bacterium]